MDQLFRNITVIISGGLGDIGRSIALEFASAGANIALGDIRPSEDAISFLADLDGLNVRSHYSHVDVSNAEAVVNWIKEVEETIGVPSIIIANAAIVTFSSITDMKPSEWSQELRVNLDGAFYLTKYATARMVEKKLPGHVVFIGSWAAHTVHSTIPAYCVSKAGLRMLCKCMALELAPHNILVNEIAPGYVDAGLSGRSFEKDAALKEQATQKVPVKKLISAKEVAREVVKICDPENRHITGSMILMDGGLSLLC